MNEFGAIFILFRIGGGGEGQHENPTNKAATEDSTKDLAHNGRRGDAPQPASWMRYEREEEREGGRGEQLLPSRDTEGK